MRIKQKHCIIVVLFLTPSLIIWAHFYVYSKKNELAHDTTNSSLVESRFQDEKKDIQVGSKQDTGINNIEKFQETKTNEFSDSFNYQEVIEETGRGEESGNANWWLNSGAYVYVDKGIAKTIQGPLENRSKWQIDYLNYNSDETDGGYHPQNIFRFVTRSKWKNFQQECYFKINHLNLSKDKNRGESNGILLFNRYRDGENLYYTGIRVDGFAVIKKKIKGEYFTMAYNRIYPGQYNRKKKPNLLPHNAWIGLRSEVKNEVNGMVSIKVFIDRKRDGNWQLITEAKDNGKSYGGKAFMDEGYAGIRTDFMDIEFDDYKIEELK